MPRFLDEIIEDYNVAIKEDQDELALMDTYLNELQLPVEQNIILTSPTQLESNIAQKIDQMYQNTIGEKIQ